MKILYITAHPKTENESRTLQLGRHFIEQYKKNNPQDEIKELNLYNLDVSALSSSDVDNIFNGESNKIKDFAEEFASADKYIFVAPMWNLNVPAKLHEYIDYVSYVGVTFKYTENGPLGLLTDKKALHITSRGGIYSNEFTKDLEMGDRYLKTILNFFGVKSYNTVALEGTNYYSADILNENILKTNEKLAKIAQEF